MTEDDLSAALERTLMRYQAMVRSVAFRYGVDDATLDEVFQEVRLRLWKALETSERIGAVTTSYVYRTAASAAVDVMRRRRAHPTEELDLEQAHTTVGRDPSPEARIIDAEVASAVDRAVSRLIDSRRPVVRMYLKGHAQAEIAELLGWSPAKVRNLLYRGLADVRATLEEEGLGPGGSA